MAALVSLHRLVGTVCPLQVLTRGPGEQGLDPIGQPLVGSSVQNRGLEGSGG